MEIKSNEQILTEYMQNHYSDEKLAALLAHAEDDKLSYLSCCCFVGIPTADHALQGKLEDTSGEYPSLHMFRARQTPEGLLADAAYCALGSLDEDRRAKLIPLIKQEMKRRDDLKSESPQVIESQEILIGPRYSMIG